MYHFSCGIYNTQVLTSLLEGSAAKHNLQLYSGLPYHILLSVTAADGVSATVVFSHVLESDAPTLHLDSVFYFYPIFHQGMHCTLRQRRVRGHSELHSGTATNLCLQVFGFQNIFRGCCRA